MDTLIVMSSKFSPKLASTLQKLDPQENIDIVVEMPHFVDPISGCSRQEKIAKMKTAFDKNAKTIEEVIQQTGGKILDRAWINQTMKARVPARSLYQLRYLKEVSAIDLPKFLEPE